MSEIDCGQEHPTIEHAIAHARTNLGARATAARGVLDVEPYWGTMGSSNVGWVVGYLISSRKRWRLDFDPDPSKLVHVNEEDFDRPRHLQKVIHRVRLKDKLGPLMKNDTQVRLYWRKWTSRYGFPGGGILCSKCRVLHASGRCPFP